MLLTRRKSEPTQPTLNMAAMIDVVFLLLIFFMCTTSFESREKAISAQLPQYHSDTRQLEDFEPVRIHLGRAGEVPVISCDDQPCVNFAALTEMLRARRAIADLPVIISGQDDVPFDFMVSALDACYEAGLTRAAYSTRADSGAL
jgi:biopolymer transport protein ExbD